MIAVVDYGMGNLRSVQKGFEHAGVADVVVTAEIERVRAADGLVLPGVGAFRDSAAMLRDSGLADVLVERARAGVPLLGICLGMQLLATVSHEEGEWAGLGLVPGRVERLPGGVKVPHIGWNTIDYPNPSPLFDGVPEGSAFYFVHSYVIVPDDPSAVAGRTEHGVPFASALSAGNVHAAQFHPEKSSDLGLRMLANFGRIVKEHG